MWLRGAKQHNNNSVSRFRLEGSSPCGIRSGYRIRAPKPKYVFFNSSCLCVPVFYALYYQQSSSSSIQPIAWFVGCSFGLVPRCIRFSLHTRFWWLPVQKRVCVCWEYWRRASHTIATRTNRPCIAKSVVSKMNLGIKYFGTYNKQHDVRAGGDVMPQVLSWKSQRMAAHTLNISAHTFPTRTIFHSSSKQRV